MRLYIYKRNYKVKVIKHGWVDESTKESLVLKIKFKTFEEWNLSGWVATLGLQVERDDNDGRHKFLVGDGGKTCGGV